MPKKEPRRPAPAVGSVFAAPLSDGRYCAVRILRNCSETRTSLVALTPWLGAFPKGDEPELREILKQHRGMYAGEEAICWWGWPVSQEFVQFASIQPKPEELSIDDKGGSCGKWSAWMVRDVVLELDPESGAEPIIGASKGPHSDEPPIPDLSLLPESEFWDLIALIDWTCTEEEEQTAPLIARLTKESVAVIAAFEGHMAKALHALDGERFAREIGESAYQKGEFFSVDCFLYARCAVVASGLDTYKNVLKNPRSMPKDLEFEPLLTVASDAYEAKCSDSVDFVTEHDYETFSNKNGWPSGT